VPKSCASFGKHVQGLTQLDNGRMQIEFKDSSIAEADAVIGCDGVKSQVRRLLLGETEPAALHSSPASTPIAASFRWTRP
jgi:salicylate hydroxylase